MKHGIIGRVAAIFLAIFLILPLISCTASENGDSTEEKSRKTKLSVGFTTLGNGYNPFFVTTECEKTLMGLTQVRLLELDRSGEPVMNGITGETRTYSDKSYEYKGICDISVEVDRENDTADYTVRLREGLEFSDGTPLTADDVIFSFYVVCDPTYSGSSRTRFSNIKGLGEYLTQTDLETYGEATACFDKIRAAGYGHLWSEDDGWTADEQKYFDEAVTSEWKADLEAVTEYCVASFSDEYGDTLLGMSGADVVADTECHVAFAMAAWGFASVNSEGILTTPIGAEFRIGEGEYPTLDDFYSEVYTIYGGDPEAYWNDVNGGEIDADNVTDAARYAFISAVGGGGVVSVTGISKKSDTELTVTTVGYDTEDIYDIFDFYVAPKHHYGSEETGIGVIFGDLSPVTDRNNDVLGAGPYVLDRSDSVSITLKKNPNYYGTFPEDGVSEIRLFRYAGDGVDRLSDGSADIVTLDGSASLISSVESRNSNGNLIGDSLAAVPFDSEYYGYIGINAGKMKVGEVNSAESIALRKAFATLFAVYRDAAVTSYYGGSARVVNYPVSSTAYFVPKPDTENYTAAFSKAADGSEIYSDSQTGDVKYAAALTAAKDYFIAAGFEYDSTVGKFVSAPEGMELEFEVIVPGEGRGDHPCYAIMKKSAEALKSVGITLCITDPTSSSSMWERLIGGDAMMWCAAKKFSPEPELKNAYHSEEIPESGGENYYRIKDSTLDRLIDEAASSDNRSERQVTYSQCIDIILDWAVELPVYRRQSFTVYSADCIDGFPTDISSYYPWYREASAIVLK